MTYTTTVLWHFFQEHPGEPVPKQNFWTLWCKGRLTEADTLTIWLGATPSGLTGAHLHHPPNCQWRSVMNIDSRIWQSIFSYKTWPAPTAHSSNANTMWHHCFTLFLHQGSRAVMYCGCFRARLDNMHGPKNAGPLGQARAKLLLGLGRVGLHFSADAYLQLQPTLLFSLSHQLPSQNQSVGWMTKMTTATTTTKTAIIQDNS